MQFIARTNRHQAFFDTLEAYVAAEDPMRLVDAIFVAALIAKKRRLQSALRPAVEKGASMPLATTARGNSSGG